MKKMPASKDEHHVKDHHQPATTGTTAIASTLAAPNDENNHNASHHFSNFKATLALIARLLHEYHPKSSVKNLEREVKRIAIDQLGCRSVMDLAVMLEDADFFGSSSNFWKSEPMTTKRFKLICLDYLTLPGCCLTNATTWDDIYRTIHCIRHGGSIPAVVARPNPTLVVAATTTTAATSSPDASTATTSTPVKGTSSNRVSLTSKEVNTSTTTRRLSPNNPSTPTKNKKINTNTTKLSPSCNNKKRKRVEDGGTTSTADGAAAGGESVARRTRRSKSMASSIDTTRKRSMRVNDRTLRVEGALACRLEANLRHLPCRPTTKMPRCALHRWFNERKQKCGRVMHCRDCNVSLCLDCYELFHTVEDIVSMKAELQQKWEMTEASNDEDCTMTHDDSSQSEVDQV